MLLDADAFEVDLSGRLDEEMADESAEESFEEELVEYPEEVKESKAGNSEDAA